MIQQNLINNLVNATTLTLVFIENESQPEKPVPLKIAFLTFDYYHMNI